MQSSHDSDQIIFAKGVPSAENAKLGQDDTKKVTTNGIKLKAQHNMADRNNKIQQDAIMGTDEILSLQ